VVTCEFFVIADGQAEVLRGDVSVTLGAGDCFGEIAGAAAQGSHLQGRRVPGLRLLCLSGNRLVWAAIGHTPSRVAADALVEQRLAAPFSQRRSRFARTAAMRRFAAPSHTSRRSSGPVQA
jgi:hypothetical protein